MDGESYITAARSVGYPGVVAPSYVMGISTVNLECCSYQSIGIQEFNDDLELPLSPISLET